MQLNLPAFELRIKNSEKGKMIFDPVRSKYVALTPEEWVRQNFLQYLIQVKKTPKNLIRVEMSLELNGLAKRSDIVVHNRMGNPLLAVECKASTVKITQPVFEQLARYNLQLNVPYLVVTNGLTHFFCKFSEHEKQYLFMEHLPEYDRL
ncbi:MAG: type I restriction enzyme HsdR N-terminal domain-containing protein [Prevotellaceae bacterium]|jgi:type I site-specific restriction endonuclease|nr:type I restriction enzyme HsdR N-terminal domain-containing protein [Prevotellaceae bacterium]